MTTVDDTPREEPRTASHTRPRRVRWIWRDILPAGMLSVTAGTPGAMKSLLSVHIAARVSQTAEVVISNVEDPVAEVTVPRLIAAEARMENVHLWPARLVDGSDTAELIDLIHTLKVKLVVLDPLTAHVPATREALLPLARAARREGCAILGLHHVVKSAYSPSAIDRVAGPTGGAIGTARALYAFGPHPEAPDTERVLAPIKVNVGPAPRSIAFKLLTRPVEVEGRAEMVPALKLVDSSADVTAEEVFAGARTFEYGDELAASAEWLTNYLRLGPRPIVETHEDGARLGLPPALLRRAADVIGTLTIRDEQDVTSWKLPERHPFGRATADA